MATALDVAHGGFYIFQFTKNVHLLNLLWKDSYNSHQKHQSFMMFTFLFILTMAVVKKCFVILSLQT